MNHDDQHISDLITALFSKSLDEIGEQLLGCTERRGQQLKEQHGGHVRWQHELVAVKECGDDDQSSTELTISFFLEFEMIGLFEFLCNNICLV